MSEDSNKWKDMIRTETGRTKNEVDQEIRDLVSEQQRIEDALQQRAVEEVRKMRLAYENAVNPNNDADKSRLVPIDGDVKAGSQVFMLHCASCHSLETQKKLYRQDIYFQLSSGPSLARVYNRPAGSNKDYGEEYSLALMQSKIFWNAYNLWLWPRNPQAMVKGTKCMAGKSYIEDPIQRTDLVKFLKAFSKQIADSDRVFISRWVGYEWMNYREYGKQKVREMVLEREGLKKDE